MKAYCVDYSNLNTVRRQVLLDRLQVYFSGGFWSHHIDGGTKMGPKSVSLSTPGSRAVKDIRRETCRQYSDE